MSQKSAGPPGATAGPQENNRSTHKLSDTVSSDPPSTASREVLPPRRGSVVFGFCHGGQSYVATVSYFPGSTRLAEIFIDAAKPGSAIAEHASDAAVLASLLLQHSVSAETIRHSISGPLATALAIAEGGDVCPAS